MDTKPDTIKVSAFHREEVSATHADLHVTIKGSSVISGDTALKKAKEVNQLVEALVNLGVKEDAIRLEGVNIETSSGVLVKSSSASYRLKIRCEKLDQFAEMLDVLASQKNASLDYVKWKYDDDMVRESMLNSAIKKAKSKAQHVAGSLGVKLLGVYDFTETTIDDEDPAVSKRELGMRAQAVSASAPNLEMDIRHSKKVLVHVDVSYRVSAF
jgi:uncharacterized protein YggE